MLDPIKRLLLAKVLSTCVSVRLLPSCLMFSAPPSSWIVVPLVSGLLMSPEDRRASTVPAMMFQPETLFAAAPGAVLTTNRVCPPILVIDCPPVIWPPR